MLRDFEFVTITRTVLNLFQTKQLRKVIILIQKKERNNSVCHVMALRDATYKHICLAVRRLK